MEKHRLRANHFDSILWGLLNFDGIETDLRLNKENDIVLYHDTKHRWKPMNKMSTEQCRSHGIVVLKDLLQHKIVRDANRKGLQFIFEYKSDCYGYKDKSDTDRFRNVLFDTLDGEQFRVDKNTHLMAFAEKLLAPFQNDDLQTYPIYPLANFCVYKNRWSMLLVKPITFYFKHTTIQLLESTAAKGYSGALFSFPYFYGLNKLYRESREDIFQKVEDLDINLIGNFYFPSLERKYDNYILLTDNTKYYPMHSKNGGKIIAHRGCGANDVKIPVTEYQDLMEKADLV